MSFRIGFLALAAGLMVLPQVLPAQIGRVIRRAADRVEAKVNREVDQAVDAAVDCAMGDQRCVEEAQRDGRKVQIRDRDGNVVTDASGNPVQTQQEASAAAEAPGTGAWQNYDFVPGDSVWVATDFTDERVGRFPARQLEYVFGNFEIVEHRGRKVLGSRTGGSFRVPLPATMPDKFTLEFVVEMGSTYDGVEVSFEPVSSQGYTYRNELPYVTVTQRQGFMRPGGTPISHAEYDEHEGSPIPVRIQVDENYAIMYLGSQRVGQVPNIELPRTNVIEFTVDGTEDYPVYLSDIVVRTGLDPLYEGLIESGEVTAHGILFDVASDRLRPESTPKLNELLEMLKRHGDLKVMIEGHTDSTGDDAANMSLSDRRAAAVVTWLVGQGIDRSRLQSVGKGETVPVGDNATEAGRQQNRRVVIRKM